MITVSLVYGMVGDQGGGVLEDLARAGVLRGALRSRPADPPREASH